MELDASASINHPSMWQQRAASRPSCIVRGKHTRRHSALMGMMLMSDAAARCASKV